jgi:hypothetical protein
VIGRAAAIGVMVMAVTGSGAGQPADLPDRDVFLREARAVFERSQQEWHRFGYKERRTDLHLNPFGRMGTGGTRLSEVRPSTNPRLTYRRVIERDGVPVSKEELDRQDAEYRARAGRAADQRDDDPLARKRASMMIDDVVATLQFDLVRREFRDGHPMIVVSFAARPGARPMTREGRLAKVFRGHVWVDEASREIIEMKAIATDDVSFGGFIAKVYEGTEAVAQRKEVVPGVWMPIRLTLTGDVRALFRKARIDYVVEWFDYQWLH